jgi:23S rRNA (adenine2503-C2)-methyltransferase
MTDRPHLRGQTPESLVALWPDLGLRVDQARRILSRVIGRDQDALGDVPGIAPRVLNEIAARGRVVRLRVADRRASQVDPFVKYLFQAPDASTFEAVRIPLEKPRFSACVSSQAGCALACTFCETGRLGLVRNLEAWEIVEQVLTIRRESPERPVTGVVFQGQGEPFQNYDNVMRAAAVLRDPCGAHIGGDRITISTVGILPMIERYTEEGHPYRLILSLTSAFDDKRQTLMPVGRGYAVADLARAMRAHSARRGGIVNVAWVLMAGVNTEPEEAAELARLFAGVKVRVSVIDINDPTGQFRRADDRERGIFLDALSARGIGFARRYSGGPDIHAACGMLASSARGGATARSGPGEGLGDLAR